MLLQRNAGIIARHILSHRLKNIMVLRHVSILSTLINKNNFCLGINDSFILMPLLINDGYLLCYNKSLQKICSYVFLQ